MICAACCKEHSARAEWRADHLGLSWSHPLIVLDRLWAVPSNAHINTGHDLHVTVGPQPHDSCWPSTSSISIPSSHFCSSDWPKFPQTFIFNNKVLPHQSTDKTDHKTASARNPFMLQLRRYLCQVTTDQSHKASIKSQQNLASLSINQCNEIHPALFGYHIWSFLWYSPVADACQALIQWWEGHSHSHAHPPLPPQVRKPSSWHKPDTLWLKSWQPSNQSSSTRQEHTGTYSTHPYYNLVNTLPLA